MSVEKRNKVQLLRSSVAQKRPKATDLIPGQPAVNFNASEPGLFFKDDTGNDIFKIGPCHIGTTAPNITPAEGGSTGNCVGEQWLDISDSVYPILKTWDGAAWVETSAAGPVVRSDTGDITGATAIANMVSISQANYNSLAVKASNTLYVITS